MTRAASFPPVVRPDARLLILGSLPGAASLAAARYYAHPRNQFWRLMGAVLETDLEALPYDARLQTLQAAGVSLWDVIGSAHCHRSLDSSIRDPSVNALAELATQLPDLRAISFNGAKAFVLGSSLLAEAPVTQIPLPSSSPAHAVPFEQKVASWHALRGPLGGS